MIEILTAASANKIILLCCFELLAITFSDKKDVPSPTWDAGHHSDFSSGAGFGTATSFCWLLDVSFRAVFVVGEILEL